MLESFHNHDCIGSKIGTTYPVLSYVSDGRVVAEFAGVKLYAPLDGYDSHSNDCSILKCAEVIVRKIFCERSGGSVWLNVDKDPNYGYCVSIDGHETIVDSRDLDFNTVYADVVEKLLWIGQTVYLDSDECPICIGWWEFDDKLYLDISILIADREGAIDAALGNNQKALYDLASSSDIDVSDELKRRNDSTDPDDLNVSTYKAYRLVGSRLPDCVNLLCLTVCAVSEAQARCVGDAAAGGRPDWKKIYELSGFSVNAQSAQCLHFEEHD